ncbi:MAG TPA: hypothetical protein VEI96_11425 [Thermodesulfovibrionales bacterium]|nr:hypothetical protein [Thermodesulfovibrionales bacterium]
MGGEFLGGRASIPAIGLLAILLSLSSCASTKPVPALTAGEEKNSLPFLERRFIGEVHSITVPPFYGDHDGWRESVQELLASSPRVNVIRPGTGGSAINEVRGGVSPGPEDRVEFLAGFGRAAGSDAVVNGVILPHKDRHEIILQLIASRDARVLWWQAREFTFAGSAPSPSDRMKMVAEMLNPLLPLLARKEKPDGLPSTGYRGGIDDQSKGDAETKAEPIKKSDTDSKPSAKQKTDKKPKKSTQPRPTTEDINPM